MSLLFRYSKCTCSLVVSHVSKSCPLPLLLPCDGQCTSAYSNPRVHVVPLLVWRTVFTELLRSSFQTSLSHSGWCCYNFADQNCSIKFCVKRNTIGNKTKPKQTFYTVWPYVHLSTLPLVALFMRLLKVFSCNFSQCSILSEWDNVEQNIRNLHCCLREFFWLCAMYVATKVCVQHTLCPSTKS